MVPLKPGVIFHLLFKVPFYADKNRISYEISQTFFMTITLQKELKPTVAA